MEAKGNIYEKSTLCGGRIIIGKYANHDRPITGHETTEFGKTNCFIEHLRLMDTKKQFLIYRSSAGSGKTFTLVKEYLTLALPNASFKDILAVTFTNSAVNEMKARILEELSKMRKAHSVEGNDMMAMLCERLGYDTKTLSEKAQKLETKILHNYSDFAICTIDSFVQNTIRPFAHDLNIPLNYEIQLENKKIKEESVRQLFSEIGHDEKFTRIVLSYLESQMDNEKAWNIEKKLVEYSNEIFKENSPTNLKKLGSRTTEEYLEFHKSLSDKNKAYKEQIKQIGLAALTMIDAEGLSQDDFYKKSNGVYAYFKKISNGEVKEMNKAAQDFIENENCRSNTKASEQNKGIIENLSGQIINYLKETEHIITKYKSHELLLENLYAMALLNAIAKFINNYSADNGILHISEFTKRLADVVFNESIPFIYERIGERYKHFLIDEFQDTSVLQWQILLPLFENTLSTNEDAFTLVVGDAKQAIYRFRQGEVEQFVKLPDIYVPTENADMQTMLESRGRVLKATGRIDNLAVNYRTAENIVRFNNTFFESLMQNDMVRDNKRVTDIYVGTNNTNERAAVIQDFSPRKKGGFVAIKFVNTDDDDARSKDDNVCEEIYQTIIDQVENKGYEYKDITVLARKKKELLKISSYLSSKNINVLSSESFLLMKNSEVLFLVSLLQVLNKPSDVVSILNVLDYLQKHSSHESEELYNSYFIGGTKNQSLFSFLKNNGYTLSFDEAELLSMTLYDCCETLIREFALYNDSKEFVTSFLNEVADYSTKNRQNLSEFLDYIAENSGKLSLKVSSTQNAVNLMTIHKSKGLEFPIVICPIFNSSKESGDKIWVELQEKEYMMPIGWVSYKEEMTKTDFNEYYFDEKNKKQLDEINILYVAFTRPKEKLFVVAQNRKKRTTKTDSIQYYLEQFIGDADEYTIGDDTEIIKQSKEDNNADKDNIHIYSLLSEKSTISISPEKTSAIEEGILIHDIFSNIYSDKDIENVIEKFKIKMGLDEEYAKTLQKRVEKIVYNENYAKYFDPQYLVKTECDILYHNGKTSNNPTIERPDRVIFSDNETWVVDFKTGIPMINYQEQINRYIEIISDMGYPNVSGEVIYC